MYFHLSSGQNDLSDEKLLALVTRSDELAFEHLFRRYQDHVYGMAYKFTQNITTAEEIVQEVFMSIWLMRSEASRIGSFKAYITTATRNQVYKHLREEAKKILAASSNDLVAVGNDVETHLLEKEYGQLLKNAVERLPTQQQKVYILVKENGLKRDEVAHIMNVAPDTIKFHLAQAMKSIRAYCAMHLVTPVFILLQALPFLF